MNLPRGAREQTEAPGRIGPIVVARVQQRSNSNQQNVMGNVSEKSYYEFSVLGSKKKLFERFVLGSEKKQF